MHSEEAKAVVNRHLEVQILLVRTRTNPTHGCARRHRHSSNRTTVCQPRCACDVPLEISPSLCWSSLVPSRSTSSCSAVNLFPFVKFQPRPTSFLPWRSLNQPSIPPFRRRYLPERCASVSYLYARPCNPGIVSGKTEAVAKTPISLEISYKCSHRAFTGPLQNGHRRAYFERCRSTRVRSLSCKVERGQ